MRRASTLRRHESDLGSWEIAERLPHPALAGAVLRYAGFAERSVAPVRRREVPQEHVTVIINFGPPLTVGGPQLPAAGWGSFVAPVNESHAITEYTGVSHGIQVDISALAAGVLFGLPMHELGQLVIDLEDVLGAGGPRLVERLYEAPGWDARFDLLDDAIGRHLDGAAVRPSPDVVWAWRRLQETRGRLAIGRLAAELSMTS